MTTQFGWNDKFHQEAGFLCSRWEEKYDAEPTNGTCLNEEETEHSFREKAKPSLESIEQPYLRVSNYLQRGHC